MASTFSMTRYDWQYEWRTTSHKVMGSKPFDGKGFFSQILCYKFTSTRILLWNLYIIEVLDYALH